MTALPQPANILRGHKSQIHATSFIRNNGRLVTGDAEGFVVVWNLAIMRPTAVWRAHESAILDIKGWGNDKLITHGRDHKLVVWKLDEESEKDLSKTPPLEDTPQPRTQPWVMHVLNVNTMNFCAFAACPVSPDKSDIDESDEILVAVPNAIGSEAMDIFHLPSQDRLHTVKSDAKNGMAMAASLLHKDSTLTMVAAFENGFVSVHVLNAEQTWTTTYKTQAHSQPVLSLDLHPDLEYFITSSADAIVAKHPIPTTQQELISAGTAAAPQTTGQPNVSGLSAAFSTASATLAPVLNSTFQAWSDVLKSVNTRHSGQQSMSMRSDGRIFATAGWDSNIRVYSARTLKEKAVLQWHNVGVYAVAFAKIMDAESEQDQAGDSNAVTQASTAMTAAKVRRLNKAKTAHWIAAGAKDGKVTLWEIY